MKIVRPLRNLVALGATALLLAGCDTADEQPDSVGQDPGALLRTAFEQMRELESYRVSGTVKTPEGMVGMDLHTHVDGRCEGRIEVGIGYARIIHDGQRTWIRGDEAFWEASADTPREARRMIALLGPKWAQVPPNDSVEELCSADFLRETFDVSKLDDDDSYTAEDVEAVGGIDATPIKEKSFGMWTTLWVSVTEPHRVLKMRTQSGDSPGTLHFDEFDHEVSTTPPDDEDVVDLTTIGDRPV